MGKNAEEKFWEALRELSRNIDKLRERQEQTEKGIDKLRESQKKTDEQINKLITRVEGISDGYGRFVEGIMSPSAFTFFTKMGFKIKRALHREKVYKNGLVYAEIDTEFVTEYNGEKYIIIGEAKSYFRQKELNKLLDKIQKLKLHEDYKDIKLIFFVASVNYDEATMEELHTRGIYTFSVADDVMIPKIPRGFKHKVY